MPDMLQANYCTIATTHKAIKTSKDKGDKIMPIQCPFIGIQIEGRRPLVIERSKYNTVTRKINVTSERVEQLPNGCYSRVIEHATDRTKGKYRFYDQGNTENGWKKLQLDIYQWAERKRVSLAKPKLDSRGRLVARLESEIKNAWRGCGNAEIQAQIEATNRALIASLQNDAISLRQEAA